MSAEAEELTGGNIDPSLAIYNGRFQDFANQGLRDILPEEVRHLVAIACIAPQRWSIGRSIRTLHRIAECR